MIILKYVTISLSSGYCRPTALGLTRLNYALIFVVLRDDVGRA